MVWRSPLHTLAGNLLNWPESFFLPVGKQQQLEAIVFRTL
jgi:hypothetical protein